MVHTAELFTEITAAEYAVLKGRTNDYLGGGINKIELYRGGGRFICKIVINLNKLSNKGKSTPKPFRVTERGKFVLEEWFANRVTTFLPLRDNIRAWTVTRIDYTLDVYSERVKEYIFLLQKGDKPPFTKIDNAKQHRKEIDKTHYKNSVRYKSKSVTVNIYNKYEERKTQNGYPENLLEDCRNIVRVEIQCLRDKRDRIRKNNKINGSGVLDLLLTEEKHREIIEYYLQRITGKGDYYDLHTATEKILNSKISERNKRNAINFIRLVNKERSVWKIKEKYEGINVQGAKTILDKIKVNAVTIPKEWGEKHIISFIALIRDD